MSEVRCWMLCVPSTQMVDVSACILKVGSMFRTMVFLGVLCWQETAKAVSEMLLLLNQMQTRIPFQSVAWSFKENWKIVMQMQIS